MSPLDRKLSRDLWRIKGQALAIALVIAVGVLLLIMMNGLVNTLEETRRAYYERYRLAEMFAPMERAPQRVVQAAASIPGVDHVAGRVIGDALIDMPDIAVPIRAQTVSLPDIDKIHLNAMVMTAGRLPDVQHHDEIVLLRAFAQAHQLQPGDGLHATMNGVQRRFDIVGIAQSPEFLYTTPPGELVPDDSRFAVIWMSEEALAAAYDLDGAFNQLLFTVDDDTSSSAILDDIDTLLEPYGGTGAYLRKDHISDRFVSEEISGLKVSAVNVPPVFLGVAAFLLYIVVSRMIQSEREEIGLLKAFGYTSFEISFHYLKLVLLIAIAGAFIGSLGGIAAGKAMAGFYQQYYKFPFLVFQIQPGAFVAGFLVSILAASLGSLWVLRQVFKLTPAVAMRPAAAPDYSGTGRFGDWLKAIFDQPSRMVLRRLQRQPLKALLAITGIAFGMALSAGMASIMASFNYIQDAAFSRIDRSDASLSFIHPLAETSLLEVQHIEGIFQVEAFRSVPVILRKDQQQYRGEVFGLSPDAQLYRALDNQLRPVPLPPQGIVLSSALARILNAQLGDHIDIAVREGRRPVLNVPVAGIADSLLGSPAYMRLETLNRYLYEPGRVSGAYLTLDALHAEAIYRQIKNMPSVIGMALKSETMAAFERVVNQGAGAMRFIMAAIAAVITFGIIYNSARIAFAERERDLASLRVIGFTRGETSFVLLGELALITLAALPIGILLGYFFATAIAEGFSTDIYQIPPLYDARSVGTAGASVVIASLVSGWLVKRDIDRIDMVSALKSKE